MLTPTIIVAERGELWLAAMRTCLRRSAPAQLQPRWLHVHGSSDVMRALATSPAAFVIAEVSRPAAGQVILQIDRWREAFPACCVVAALDREQSDSQRRETALALRDAGAVYVVRSPRKLGELLPLLERHANATPATLTGKQILNWNDRLSAAWDAPTVDLPACWSGLE